MDTSNCFRKKRLLGLDSSYEKMEALVKSERSPHALLILGEKGVGKRTFALHFSMALLCKRGLYPCFSCVSCNKATNFNHPDIIYVKGNEKTGSIGVGEIRSVRQASSKVPQESDKKIFIIEDAENLTVEAQNAFLKILEEPPEDTVFILTCSKEEALLETVLSRLTSISLPVIGEELKKEALEMILEKPSEEELCLAAGIFSTVGQCLDVMPGGPLNEIYKKSLDAAVSVKEKNRYSLLKIFSCYQTVSDREKLKLLYKTTLSVCLYYCKEHDGIEIKDMEKINRAFCTGLAMLSNNVSSASVSSLVTEDICS